LIYGVIQVLFSICALISGSVCLATNQCNLSEAMAGALIGFAVAGLINSVRMLLMYCMCGKIIEIGVDVTDDILCRFCF